LKKHTYTLIALGILAGPLAFSFEPRIHFWTHWPALFTATLLVGLVFIVWDILVVKYRHWKFNPEWTGTWRLFGLPLGEYLFFLTVPYAMIFVYEAFRFLLPDRMLFHGEASSLYAFSALAIAAAAIWHRQGYTVLALVSAAVFLTTTGLERSALVGTSGFWVYMIFGFAAFGVVNGLYTSLPTIHYTPKAIWGVRIGTIPLEDFFYNLSYLGLILDFYSIFRALGLS
jgi:lycopene cyclase domain-containing protein